MAQRVAITIDLGADAPIEVIRQTIDDLDIVCQFGGELQYRTAIVDAAAAVLNDPERWIRRRDFEKQAYRLGRYQFPIVAYTTGMPPNALVQSGLFEVAIARYLEETETTGDSITTVHSIRYSNPIEIVVGIGLIAYLVLQVVRDWPSRRRLNAAVATDVENTVLARKELRDLLLRRIANGEIPVSLQQVDDLLTLDIARAMSALGDQQLDLRALEAAANDVDVEHPDDEAGR
jgi:hypothetical protein